MTSSPDLPSWAEPPPPGRAARPPAAVGRAFAALVAYVVVALGWGLVSLVFTAVAVVEIPGGLGLSVGAPAFGLLLEAVVYGVGLYIAVQLRAGQQWARPVLGIAAGVGLVLGVVGLISGLDMFAVTAEIFGAAYPVLGLVVRVVEMALLGTALTLIFRPSVTGFLR